jgi:2,6-dihydroxypseudooxynicotine hydrolase
MASDPRVDLTFSLFKPRYIQTGVDPFDLERLVERIDRWEDWCAIWSDEARKHERLGDEALAAGRKVSAGEAYLRAAIYYHYGKHYFLVDENEYRRAHEDMLRCYNAASVGIDPPMQKLDVPFEGTHLSAYIRVPKDVARPPVAIILPGLDACKEELHAWSDAFVARGMATVTLDGPGQGETAFRLHIRPDWGRVIGAVIDVLLKRDDVDGERVGVVGQSLGGLYAPRAAALEPRIKACVANCGPFDYGALYLVRPRNHLREMFLARTGSSTWEEGLEAAKALSLNGLAEKIACPLLVVFGGGDKLIPPSEGERLCAEASGPSEFVYFEEGNHVCFNITYKFRPLTADWMAEHLRAKS